MATIVVRKTSLLYIWSSRLFTCWLSVTMLNFGGVRKNVCDAASFASHHPLVDFRRFYQHRPRVRLGGSSHNIDFYNGRTTHHRRCDPFSAIAFTGLRYRSYLPSQLRGGSGIVCMVPASAHYHDETTTTATKKAAKSDAVVVASESSGSEPFAADDNSTTQETVFSSSSTSSSTLQPPSTATLSNANSLSWNKRWRRRAGSVFSAVGFVASSSRALLAGDVRAQLQTQWKPTVAALRAFLARSGIDLELTALLNVRLLDNLIILSRVERAASVAQGLDRRDLALLSSCCGGDSNNDARSWVPSTEKALR